MSKIDDLLWASGILADGCWDELDDYARESVYRLVKETVIQISVLVQDLVDHRIPASEYPTRIRENWDLDNKLN